MKLVLHIALIVTTVVGLSACDEKTKAKAPEEPWTFESERAPYALTLAPDWQKEDPAVLNEFADLAVAHRDNLFFIVIPQELPSIEGVDAPDALDLKRAGVALMETQIANLEIQKQGPVRVDERQGQSVVARGVVDEQEVKYVTTYLTEGSWGFQLVGWAPIQRQHDLLVRVDELLAGWKFKELAPEPKPSEPETIESMDVGPEPEHDHEHHLPGD